METNFLHLKSKGIGVNITKQNKNSLFSSIGQFYYNRNVLV